jgi:hypothetical protein
LSQGVNKGGNKQDFFPITQIKYFEKGKNIGWFNILAIIPSLATIAIG